MFKLSAVAVNLNKAIDNQRTASMFVTLCLAQVTLKQSAPLTVAQCWEMLGFEGEPSKQAEHKQAYNKANSLQKKASRVAKALDGDKQGELWTEFVQILEAIDFTAEAQDFYDIEKFAHKKAGLHLDDAGDVLALLTKATGSQATTKTTQATNDGEQTDADGVDVADKVADVGLVDQAAKALLEMAQGIPAIKAALVAIAGLTDPQAVAAKMAEAWMAERRQLCAKLDSLERVEETQAAKIAKLEESLKMARAQIPAKAPTTTVAKAEKPKRQPLKLNKNSAMADAMAQAGAAA